MSAGRAWWRRGLAALVWLGLVLAGGGAARAEAVVPRIVVALYDGREEDYALTCLHRPAEMPPNHLGLVVIPSTSARACRPIR
ncbi:MAG: hypothetical protein KIT16_04845 [Rhodospirillaceae bacterium]|nr:hypothetical protein [Rhodospirillaceae bacterium]